MASGRPSSFAAFIAASAALFGQGELASLDADTLAAALRELAHVETSADTTIVQLLVDTKLVSSASEARRAISQGGVYLNNVAVADDQVVVGGDLLPGNVAVLRRGKKTLAGIFVTS